MSFYKTFEVHGTKRYMRDGKLIAAKNLPPHILKNLQNVAEFDDEVVTELSQPKVCIFCGAPTKLSRFLNLQTVYVCKEHYYSKTVGETAQLMMKGDLVSG